MQKLHFMKDGQAAFGGKNDAENYSPIYLCPEAPYWLVPNKAGARLLESGGGAVAVSAAGKDDLIRAWNAETGIPLLQSALEVEHFFGSLDLPVPAVYPGRSGIKLEKLSELWLHITDDCNLRCKHCLFGGNFSKKRELALKAIKQVVTEAVTLGCGLICFTGGEPFLYPEFIGLLEWVQDHAGLRVAILTNGTLIEEQFVALQKLDLARLHLQVSLEGPEEQNEAIRGVGTFIQATQAIARLRKNGFSVSVATTVETRNMASLPDFFATLAELDVSTIHFQYHFQRGFGADMEVAISEFRQLLPKIFAAAEKYAITIDNLEALRAQVFSPPGTRFDFGNGGWESLAVGPDGAIFPTPATIDIPYLNSGNLAEGLAEIWRNSSGLREVRELSLLQNREMASDPYRFLIGGGDLDRSLVGYDRVAGFILKPDPYAQIARDMVRYLINREASALTLAESETPGLRLRMGDITTACPAGAEVNFTHCNCLLSMGQGTHNLVRNFYGSRAETPDETILNPVAFAGPGFDIIPEEARGRMYGCGSPVADAAAKVGETLVDLGSGTGVECFLAARKVGPAGRVFGIDMTDRMLNIADRAKEKVAQTLGYHNIEFKKGLLEELPLAEAQADVVISNCVVNLSGSKRRVFQEIFRVLKPGGRLVISDVVTESEPPPAVRADHQLAGECIGGAMVQDYLLALLKDMGFVHVMIVKRFPYRVVLGHDFYSLTYTAWKPALTPENAELIYAGPFAALVSAQGRLFPLGKRIAAPLATGFYGEELAANGMLTIAPGGAVTNVDAVCGCDCSLPPDTAAIAGTAPVSGCDCGDPAVTANVSERPVTGCLVCGAPLRYFQVAETRTCSKCGTELLTNSVCVNDHFVCDSCHILDPLEVIKRMSLAAAETDMIVLLQKIRESEKFPLHGPEHHALIPAVILSCYRNLGGKVTDAQILQGIERGRLIPGGACGFMGSCGAATGAGIAFSILLAASPLTPDPRAKIQFLVAEILRDISEFKASRCCQREAYTALSKVVELAKDLLPIRLQAQVRPVCRQYKYNRECIHGECPFFDPGPAAGPGRGTVFPMVNGG